MILRCFCNLSLFCFSVFSLSVVLIAPVLANPEVASDADLSMNEETSILLGTGKPLVGIANRSSTIGNNATSNDSFSHFNTEYSNRWQAVTNEDSAALRVKLLYGATSKSYLGSTNLQGKQLTDGLAEKVAHGFLRDTHKMFGLSKDLVELKTDRIDRTNDRYHIRFQQTYKGMPVVGAEVIVHTNMEGQVTMVQNNIIADMKVANSDTLSKQQALEIVRSDLVQQLPQNTSLGDSKAEKLIKHFGDKDLYSWKVTTATRNTFGLWVYYIDAESGEILYRNNEIHSLKSGKGKVFKTNSQYYKGKVSGVGLKSMFTEAEGFTKGFLWGLHAEVIDNNGNNPFKPNLKFFYNPSNALQKDSFDVTQAYYKLNKIWAWWEKKVIKKYGPAVYPPFFNNYSVPTFGNVVGLCNAFYSSDITGGGFPGFAFGDDDACYSGSEDLMLDDEVFRHEYAHAMMDWLGFNAQFGGALHGYGRSMGEGNSDWYAFLANPKDSKIGDIIFPPFLRELNNTRIYPDDVDFPTFGTPEEHYTGEIWGGFLFDLYSSLKKKALGYVYESHNYFSAAGGHRAVESDFFDAILAMRMAELDLHGNNKNSIKAWGAMTSRGLNAFFRTPYNHASDYFGTAAAGSDDSVFFFYNFPPAKAIETKGYMLNNGDAHEYIINVTESMSELTSVVKAAKKKGILNPTIQLFDSSGTLLINSVSTSSKVAKLVFTGAIVPGVYILIVRGTTSDRGQYSFKVAIK